MKEKDEQIVETPEKTSKKDNKKNNKKDKKIDKKTIQEEKKQLKLQKEHFKYLGEEEDEKTNPKIRVYNEIVRHAYEISDKRIDCQGIRDIEELSRIFIYVLDDYPDIFWLDSYVYWDSNGVPTEFQLKYRCLKPNGEVDIQQIERKKKELRQAAKPFISGIKKNSSAYDAFLLIYRRLILTLDYDGIGLNAKIDKDKSQDDRLRSLHSALVNHKVVCAGYATALQYLLHLVGIVCGYVSSEEADGITHAFNVVKIGKYCYFCDPTWGDYSNTLNSGFNKEFYKELVFYDYCLVPTQEFLYTAPGSEPHHMPSKHLFPRFKPLKATNHEYYRYHKYFISNYNEDEMVRIFTDTVKNYDKKECGMFTVSYRALNSKIGKYVMDEITKNNCEVLHRIIEKTKANLKDKSQKALFDLSFTYSYFTNTHIGMFYFYKETSKSK